ncbi:MAG: hypothetical protein HUJ73_06365 [Eubacterium sp.]|nr:hypothetical protein [Eubacterium sp.]
MQIRRASSTFIFLLELTMGILIFAIAAGVCLTAFAKTYTLSARSAGMNLAVEKVTGTAELCRAAASFREIEENMEDICGICETSPDQITVYYSEEGVPVEEEDAVYVLETTCTEQDPFLISDIVFRSTEDGEEIYSLQIKKNSGEVG